MTAMVVIRLLRGVKIEEVVRLMKRRRIRKWW